MDQVNSTSAQVSQTLSSSAFRSKSKGPPPPAGNSWVSIGPAPINGGQVAPPQTVSGRVTAIAVDPVNSAHWLIGGAQGGVWASFDAGSSWAPMTDDQASLAMGAIAFAPSDPSTVYAGTGEAHFSLDSYAGAGLLKSVDGGVSWQLLASNTFGHSSFSHIRVDPSSANNLTAATTLGYAGRGAEIPTLPPLGIFTSTDGGVTWTARLKGEATGLDVDPTSFANQYGALGDQFGDPANGVYRSTDSGATWTGVTGPWSQSQARVGRIELAIAPSARATMYVSIHNVFTASSLGVWVTTNAWDPTPTWTALPTNSNFGDQMWYDHVVTVDPTNANVVYVGAIALWKCDGTNWTAIGGDYNNQTQGRKIHPDQHALGWAGDILLVGNDGGFWASPDRGSTFVARNNNLALTQFYDGSLHPSNPNFVIGGAQDNGTEIRTNANSIWQWIWFGDGCDNAISADNPDTDWAVSSQSLSIYRTKNAGATFDFVSFGLFGFPLFAAPFEESPFSSDTFLAGMDSLWKSTNFFTGASPTWVQNSPSLGFEEISAIAFAPSDNSSKTYAYGASGGSLRMTSDGGTTWRDLNPGGTVPGRYITGLAFHPANPNILYVSLSGFDDATPAHPGHLFVTTNALATSPSWYNVSPPVNIPNNRVVLDPLIPNVVYVGTDIAVWKSIDGGSSWNFMGPSSGFPNVAVFDLKISRVSNRLIAFTHGRGAFSLNLVGGGNSADVFASGRVNPNPLILGNGNLTYTLTVGNNGSLIATNVVASQVLPSNVAYISSSTSQGNVSQSGGIVNASLGNLGPGAFATITVVVAPLTSGSFVSSVSAGSDTPDPDNSNNSATISSTVLPRTSDIAVGIIGSPNPVLVGQLLTYSVSVTNFGPSTATGVMVTNVLPASVGIVSVTGSNSINGNTVVCFFNSLTNNGRASATIRVIPNLDGTIAATATGTANEADPVPANSSVTATVVVGPAANLGLAISANPLSVVRGSNITYTISVTNFGPSSASGVVVNDSLPAGVSVIATNTTRGVLDVSGSTVTASIGPLTNGETVRITVGITTTNVATNVFTITSSATVAATEADPVTGNNSASVNVSIAPPFVAFGINRAQLLAESFSPTNGTLDPGENVSVSFFLQNIGNISNVGPGLNVSLLATNGVLAPSAPKNYGVFDPALVVSQTFSFTASTTNGSTITATLLLQDPNLPTNQILTYTFSLPVIQTFANTNQIDLPTTAQDQLQPGPAAPYPSVITVSGVTGILSKVTVTLSNLSHTFPHDLSFLLVGPTGVKSLMMAHAANDSSASGLTLTFDDSAPAPLPQSGQLVSGPYQPASYSPSSTFSNPAPAGPYQVGLTPFINPNPNGLWALYALDDAEGDFGYIGNGWAISLTTINPVNQVADIITSASSSPASLFAGDLVTNTFIINNTGPSDIGVLWVTNTLAPGVVLVSANNSAGTAFTINGNILKANLGPLLAGSSRSVSLVVSPQVTGTVTNSCTAVAASGEVDLTPANNSASATFTVLANVADLAVTNFASPNPVTIGSNLAFTVTVTNRGPNTALGVVLSNTLPSGVFLVSSNASQGSVTAFVGTNLVASFGNIAAGTNATLNFVVAVPTSGSITNIARVSASSSDTNIANNSITNTVQVIQPRPFISAAGALLLGETGGIHNAAIDVGERVTIAFYLTNSGSADSTNLTATLLSGNGVTAPSAPASYGTLVHGGPAGAANFSFTAASTSNGVLIATLQLTDAGGYATNVSYAFLLPSSLSSTNPNPISIPDHGPATPYPSSIFVSGMTGVVEKVTVTIKGLSHSFPDDIDILLVSPSGQKIVLMSDAGGGHSLTNINLTFDDSAASQLPDSAEIVSGIYQPTDYETGDIFPAPAPAGAASTSLGSLSGVNPNGTWSLYVADDSVGDSGSISGGWSISITTISPVSPAVNLVLTMSATPQSALIGSPLTYTLALTNLGPSTATNVFITDTLPSILTLVSYNSTAGTILANGQTVTITNVTLAAGAGLSASIRTAPTTSGTVVNTATATSAQLDLDPASNTAQVSTTVLTPVPVNLTIARSGASQFQFSLAGDPNQAYRLEASSNLSSWTTLATGTSSPAGTLKFTNSPSATYQFYRSRRLP